MRKILIPVAVTGLMAISTGSTEARAENYIARPLPSAWTADTTGYFALSTCDDVLWWRMFEDPVLDSLVSLGVAENYDLGMAMRRIEASKAALGNAAAAYYPQLGLSAGWSKQRASGLNGPVDGKGVTSSVWNAAITMSWEIDVFGKIRSKVKSAKAGVEVSRGDYAAAMVALQAEIASQYIQLRVWQEQYRVAQAHAERQLKLVSVTKARYEAELASKLDLAQARTVYYSTIATIPALESLIETGTNSLAVLVGKYPGEIDNLLDQGDTLPDYHGKAEVGLPLSLLERRADIVALRKQIDADAAMLGYERKQYLPSLSITGSIGTQAHDAKNLFKRQSYTYTIAPTLSWNIFDGFARRAAVRSAEASLRSDIDSYNQVVMTAVQEVDNAMSTYLNTGRQIESLDKVVTNAEEAEKLAFDNFTGGLTPIINVVNAQLTYLQYENSVLTARGKALMSLINLYKALGGGWDYKNLPE